MAFDDELSFLWKDLCLGDSLHILLICSRCSGLRVLGFPYEWTIERDALLWLLEWLETFLGRLLVLSRSRIRFRSDWHDRSKPRNDRDLVERVVVVVVVVDDALILFLEIV